MERQTFSPNWSRVNQLTPTLRPQVLISRRIFRGHPWYVLHDPLGNTFSRLNPVAYYMIGLLDGERSVEEAWQMTLERHGDAAPTQNEVIGLLGQLNQANLLRGNVPPDAEPLLQRHRRMKLKRWTGQAMSVLFMQVPLFNPDRLLRWLGPLFRPLL
ncbi:MAG: PqqD family protein, partial [Desulfobacterales bacterium]|nr:PqqD family protein [Desulfobacterales bacterium]